MPKSTQRLRRLIIGTGVLLVAAFVGSAAFDGWRLRQQVSAATERELSNLARALADETARTLQSVDLLLRETASWYASSGAKLDAEAVTAALAMRAVGVAQVGVLTIVDANGLQRYRSRQTGEPLANVSDRPYFQAQRDRADADLYINAPVVTRTDRQPALVVSRRLTAPDGSFGGVVTAIVGLQRLQGMFSAIQLGEGSALLLALDDGTLVVRQPFVPGVQGTLRVPELAAFKGGPLIDRAVSPVDGRAKLIAAIGVGKRPLTLAITRDDEVASRPWRDAIRGAVVRTLLMVMLIVLTVIGLLRQLRRQELGEQALRQSEERYAMAMEAANEGHAEWNLARNTVFASDKWRALHGMSSPGRPKSSYRSAQHEGAPVSSPGRPKSSYRSAQHEGTAVTEYAGIDTPADVLRDIVLHPDDAAPAKAALDDHLAGRTPAIELEYRVRLPDGAWRWIHVRGRCLRDAGGAPLRLFCSAVDVSERKAAEAEKAGLEARLQQTQRLEALGTLAGGIAHDFNNILGAILGFGQMAQQHAEPDSAMRRHIDRVLQAGGRARLLVRRILDFSRSGVAERVPVSLQAVVEEVIAMLRPTLPSGIAVHARLEAGHAAVVGDATQLYQVVMNLCTNAVQAIAEDGSVELTLQRVDLHEPRALLQGELRPGPHLHLEVADSGAGITPDVLARMFDPFFTTKEVGEGTGLGLSVVHGIVSDLGGAIDVAAREGPGTRVSIWLPVSGEAEPPSAAPPSACPRGNGEVVMVVDDESSLVDLAEELLAELGYEPVGFSSADAALHAFEADPHRFDALLSDEAMPGLRGIQLALAVSARRTDLPVILMSGNVDAGLEQRAREAGIVEVLHKPLALQAVAESLARALRERRTGEREPS